MTYPHTFCEITKVASVSSLPPILVSSLQLNNPSSLSFRFDLRQNLRPRYPFTLFLSLLFLFLFFLTTLQRVLHSFRTVCSTTLPSRIHKPTSLASCTLSLFQVFTAAIHSFTVRRTWNVTRSNNPEDHSLNFPWDESNNFVRDLNLLTYFLPPSQPSTLLHLLP